MERTSLSSWDWASKWCHDRASRRTSLYHCEGRREAMVSRTGQRTRSNSLLQEHGRRQQARIRGGGGDLHSFNNHLPIRSFLDQGLRTDPRPPPPSPSRTECWKRARLILGRPFPFPMNFFFCFLFSTKKVNIRDCHRICTIERSTQCTRISNRPAENKQWTDKDYHNSNENV